jgi:F-type H+-transporting ATPase subunit b
MRHGFGLNTNVFETNVINLAVVVGIVVTVIGDALRSLLDQRRQMILSALEDADKKVNKAQQRLDDARKAVEAACCCAQEIRKNAIQTAEQESELIRKQLKIDLQRLSERSKQAIQLEYQRTMQAITKQVTTLALTTAESILIATFNSNKLTKQKELIDRRVRETLCTLTVD